MTIQEEDIDRKLWAMLAVVPAPLPHYGDDPKTQRRVGMTLSATKQPLDIRARTIWL